jgi:hypothetical protein
LFTNFLDIYYTWNFAHYRQTDSPYIASLGYHHSSQQGPSCYFIMPAIPTEHSLSSLYSSEEYDFNGSGAAGLALLFKPTQMARQQEHLKGHQAYDSHSDPSTPESIDRHGQRSKLKAAD